MDEFGGELEVLPKVELHLHLDCCMSFDVASVLDPSLSYAEYREHFVGPDRCTDLMDLLGYVARPLELMQTEGALRLVVEDLFDQLRADHVIYAEIRLAPLLHTRRGLSPSAVLEAVTSAAADARLRTGVRYGILVCTLRHFSEAESLESAYVALERASAGVVGFDIAGDEAGFSLDAHVGAFDVARSGGLGLTAHAGEALGAGSVRETLERLGPSRIGHGVRSVEDPVTVEILKAGRIHLEVCPTSNVQSRVCESVVDHPVDRLRQAGVSLGINADGYALCNVTLRGEYQRLGSAFGWDALTLLDTNRSALEASFAPAAVKAQLAVTLAQVSDTSR